MGRCAQAEIRLETVEVGGAGQIYLICDEKDRKATVASRKFCRDQGFEIKLPVFTGDAAAVRESHRQRMTTCDAVVLYYGAGDEAWKSTQDNELKKMSSYRGGRPLYARYTYLAEPRTADKDDLVDMEEPDLIDGLERFSETAMATFMQAMKKGEAAT